MVRYDKLGRKIPEFDRSAASKKGAQTRIKKDGNDVFKKIGAEGGKASNEGYFKKLKKQDPEKLQELTRKGGIAAQRLRKIRADLRGRE